MSVVCVAGLYYKFCIIQATIEKAAMIKHLRSNKISVSCCIMPSGLVGITKAPTSEAIMDVIFREYPKSETPCRAK